MRSFSLLSFVLYLTISLVCILPGETVDAEEIRKPAKAGTWYPADANRIRKDIADLTRRAKESHVQIPPNKNLRALILPHAGIACSGWTAAHASFVLTARQFPKVILMGPDHYRVFKNAGISNVSDYQTPLGTVKLHPDAEKLRLNSRMFQSSFVSDRNEHSLEMVLLFLQSYIQEFELIPIVVGPTNIPQLAAQLNNILDSNTLLVVSSDLYHFLPYAEVVARDKETIAWIMNPESADASDIEKRACGVKPLSILRHLAQQHNWQPVLLHYSNSGDTCGDRTSVVGYAAIAFFGDQGMQEKRKSNQELSEAQGNVLLQLARQTIMQELGKDVPVVDAESVKTALLDQCYRSACGTFVTLKINGQLRGCIGNLTASEPLSEGVRRNAVNAAFQDPRFPPLTETELEQVDIEVSILTEPQPLDYTDAADLLTKLRVNVDGVIIRKGHSSATFLPQVWEQLPEPEDFLSHLCMKAGLGSKAWRESNLEVLTYQVQYFEEHN